ncbi:S-layer homology domain-containing protein [Jeotgalibacillus salarius]|uniref:S-layer homology domain-containing protein n=1 Tax=Jeotgalibacillus salarius TaxID=546023 RepID=UPI00141A82B2|nr:S-layer homology domain-containing protein [Jeotgalibacillus salarius]
MTAPNLNFHDMSPGGYGYDKVANAVELDIINGSNGYFKPWETVTRAQMAAILSRAYDLEGNTNSNFTDVNENHWAYSNIQALVANKITTGYSDQTFRPNAFIQRQHFSLFLERNFNDFFKPGSPGPSPDPDPEPEQKVNFVGTIKDDKGELISGAEIQLYDENNDIVAEAITIGNGEFIILVESGEYSLSVTHENYEAYELQELTVNADAENEVNITLQSTQVSFEYLELNQPYVSGDNGMTVELNSLEKIDQGGFYEYIFNYTETNHTKDVIPQGAFKLYFQNEEPVPQYGFFNDLYPGESATREYRFKVLKSSEPYCLEYGGNLFFKEEPTAEILKWEIS